MVQMRLMHDDPERVRELAEVLLPLLRAAGLLVGDSTELANRRGGGLRVVADVRLPDERVRVTAEPGEPEPSASAGRGGRAGVGSGPRALPSGRSRRLGR